MIVHFHGNAETVADMDGLVALYRGAGCSVRYPGFTDGTGRHTDGFSLLPASGTERAHNQLKFWYYLSDVGPGMAPISFWPTQWSDDGPSVCGPEESFQAPAGSL